MPTTPRTKHKRKPRKLVPPRPPKTPGVVKSFGIYSQGNFAGVDQGVDFRGKGAIPALASGIVTDIGRATIIEGQKIWYVIYKATSGAYKGHYFYVAENFVPTVRKGQHIKLGQSIGRALGTYPYTETGFNRTGSGWNPVAPLYPNPHGAKAAGGQMWQYIQGVVGLAHPVTGANAPASQGGGGGVVGGLKAAASVLSLGLYNPNAGTSAPNPGLGVGGDLASTLNIGSWQSKILAAGAIAGGGIVFIMGLILVAADAGLSTRAAKTAETLYVGRAISRVTRSRTRTNKPESTPSSRPDYSAQRERRAQERHEADLKVKQARATEIRTRQKNRRRTRKEQEESERKAYYKGATDAASPTMTKIRKSKKRD